MKPSHQIIFTVARHEWHGIRRRKAFWGLVALLAFLLGLATLVGWRDQTGLERMRAEAERSQRKQWVERNVDSAHSAAHGGITVFRPFPLLGTIDPGLHPYAGVSIFLEAHHRNALSGAPLEDAAPSLRMSLLSVSTVLQLVLPLILIVFLALTFAGEKESGTLRLILSLGIDRRSLLVGKALGILVPLAFILIAVGVMGWVGMATTAGASIAWRESLRLFLLICAYFLYLLVITCAILAISISASSTRMAFAASIVFWIFACFLLPRAANEIAARLYPTQDPDEISTSIRSAEKAIEQSGWFERKAQIEKELMGKYKVRNVKELPVSPFALLLSEWEEKTTKIQNARFQELFDQQERQHYFVQAAGFLTPTTAIETISMALSGADPQHLHHFSDDADAYRFRMTQAMNEDLFANSSGASRDELIAAFHARQKQVYEKLPPFQYNPPGLKWALKNVRIAIAALALWLIGGVIAAFIAVNRMRVI